MAGAPPRPAKGLGGQRRTVPVIAALQGVMADFNGKQAAARRSHWPTSSCSAAAPRSKRPLMTRCGDRIALPPAAATRRKELTDIEMFEWLKPSPTASATISTTLRRHSQGVSPEEMFLDKAKLLSLTSPNGWHSSVASGP